MNVPVVLASVPLMLTVSTPLVATPVPVDAATVELDSPVQVNSTLMYPHFTERCILNNSNYSVWPFYEVGSVGGEQNSEFLALAGAVNC